jgi:UDP-N-acetylglucosamine 2-epimerase (non-hydrolysing)
MQSKKKIIDIIAGARPNFVKIASLFIQISKTTKIKKKFKFRLIHTGQHYDKMLSDTFFQELKIPKPNFSLNVGSGSHALQTANIMKKYEKIILKKPPNLCIVVGDVNSTVACAISAKKLGIKVAHIEAGLRSGDLSMPEEINRILTDSITDYFFTTSRLANKNLLKNGIESKNIYFVGNTMIDTLKNNLNKLNKPSLWEANSLANKSYYLLTLHRPSNVDDIKNLKKIISIIKTFNNEKFIFPVHPRTMQKLNQIKSLEKNLIISEPLSYFHFNYLLKNAKGIITDSGGITEEATFFKVPCFTMRENTERPETINVGSNVLIGNNYDLLKRSINEVNRNKWKKSKVPEKWDGKAAYRILNIIEKLL